ncbi:MAG: hypothetical protein FWE07_08755 [Turicibacter sp.]|nr:hypothetical protein [Turicibacter sp.]
MKHENKTDHNAKRAIVVYMVIVALLGIAMGLSDNVFSNYFRDAFHVNAFQRGLIEVPRETPGVIAVLILSGFAFLGNIKLGIIAQILTIIGLFAMAMLQPSFEVMLVYLFVTSLGIHLFIPLYDGIGMSLASKREAGKILGRFNSIRVAFSLFAGLLVFWGFNAGFFSFATPRIVPFIVAGILLMVITVLLVYLLRLTEDVKGKSKLVFRKAYLKFYVMAFLFGGRKQIMFVFGPWVLIELLDFGADYIALLIVAGAALGIFLLPFIGRLIDKFGTGKVLMAEAIGFLLLYLGYGVISFGIVHELFAGGIVLIVAIGVNIFDRVVAHMGMVRSVYVRQIAVTDEDVTPTLAAGMTLDHIVGISSALLGGWIWHNWGPWYVFMFSAVLALGNLWIAYQISKNDV